LDGAPIRYTDTEGRGFLPSLEMFFSMEVLSEDQKA
jgi:hypothetical protein